MTERAHHKTFAPEGAQETRYVRAQAVWDERLGHTIVQAKNWRLACFAALLVALVSLIGLIIQSTKASVIPYLVEVESSGQVRLVGAVTEQHWELSASAKRVELERWIRNLRSLSTDERVLTERFAYVRTHATESANLQIDQLFEESDPWARFGEQARTVEIVSVTTLPGSAQAYRVEWREEIYSAQGVKEATEEYVGEFHLSLKPPTEAAQLEVNPLGVFVSFFDFDQKR